MRELLKRVDEAVDRVRALARDEFGELHIGYAPSPTMKILPPALAAFQKAAPRVKVVLHDLAGDEQGCRIEERNAGRSDESDASRPAALVNQAIRRAAERADQETTMRTSSRQPHGQSLRLSVAEVFFAMGKRLFIALELPESVRRILTELDPRIKGLRWLSREQLHATLSFLDRVNSGQEERLREALSQVRVPPFFLPIQGIGTFGGARPTVVWAGLGKGHPHLFALHKHLQDAVLRAGLEPDLRPFHPHITLGRVNGLSGATLLPFLRRNADVEFGLWKVTGFAMFSSVLTSEGPIHTLEMRCGF